ncbi:MAG: polyphosphate polymerase domain-containing protein [Erysipelotrichaceae bacterium]|nr:polyphosphate polymerase domain-containing protein [Erysipelotrichaceae bacterium]
MKYRHEYKHEINYLDSLILQSRLKAVMKSDTHTINGIYKIRSIYFDNLYDKALKEKIDGVNKREKFRIRFYNNDTSYIVLEKKSKINGLCSKESCVVTKEEALKILNRDINWLINSDRPLCKELYTKMKYQGLYPKTIVDYSRIPYIYGPGNVRVTIDYDIRTGEFRNDFLNKDVLTLSAGDPIYILEVKWDEYLPDIIKDAVSINGRHVSAFSKYERCRIYG